ncbi:bestrophin family ion channel [Chlorogloeopsis fritschii]|uniref:bestrophin family ion channel n=1 Tax=Chlorogloeopsis fritschii TaxID=1124 RepID=UPI0023F1D5FB|nr:bestrophin family ion channel [Chlorogloeopsis fritschii]
MCSGFAFFISLTHYYGFDLAEQIFSSVTTNEEIGNQIENPFSNGANDLPIDEICNTLVKNIEDIIKSESATISASV